MDLSQKSLEKASGKAWFKQAAAEPSRDGPSGARPIRVFHRSVLSRSSTGSIGSYRIGQQACEARAMTDGRRPIATRSATWARWVARQLDSLGFTPNSISIASIGFAAISGAAAWTGLWLVAAAGIQLRLLCNLFDGMVAVEGGKATATGGVYNELPDRLADSLTLIGIGYGCGWPQLGLWCALGAALTAYVRVLGASLGAPHFFFGPMAKQHRMALCTAALMVAHALWPSLLAPSLGLILAGTLITSALRARAICAHLEKPQD
jgi:phosphatidylglycerophosphate synthase